jgi:ABC-2 type transport system ATP-binding protein
MIQVSDLQKSYGGKRVLGPLEFEIKRGETVGVLGRNGAGKTTLLRILASDLRPSAGSVLIDGVDAVAHPNEARLRVGYLPEVPPIYEDMRVGDFLEFAGKLRGMSPERVAARLPEVERLTQVTHYHDELIRHLSHGYRQRVGVAQAIIHEPPLLILDEPTHDLDPVQIVEMRTLIQNLKGKHTVFVSSHILTEIRETCDRLLVISAGKVVATGSEGDLASRFLQTRVVKVGVRVDGSPKEVEARAATALRGIPGVENVAATDRDDELITFAVSSDRDCRAEVARALVTAGLDVLLLERAGKELENVFLELVGERVRGRDFVESDHARN